MKVLIAGGGIAGPAAAIALAKAGISAEVFEAYPEGADDTGAFLTLTANGQDALHAIDADQPVFAGSFPATRLSLFSPSGSPIINAPLGRDHPCPRTITRAGLSQILRAKAAERGIPIRYRKRVTAAAIGPDSQVTVTLCDGTRATGDLLIGADGIHSPVRTLIDPAAPAPRYTGLTVACGYSDALPDDRAGNEGYAMYFGGRAFFGCTIGPDNRTWWFARIPDSTPANADSYTADRAASAFDADNTPAAKLIRSTPGALTVTAAHDIAHLPTWSNGTMTVIGDAAHATSPATTQGASMAIEDAVILAQCLRDIPRQANAIATFEHLRRSRVERIVQSGASGENPAPPAPGPRKGNPAETAHAHHLDWDAKIAGANTITIG
jgi:2-polyprenyl-6-methoxyphenol hydroxylase-like FAD-dependent oxidoreductase